MMRPSKLRISYQPTKASLHFHCAFRFDNPMTCAHVRLLGPCFKTGRIGHRQNTKAEQRLRGLNYSSTNGTGPEAGALSTSAQKHPALSLRHATLSITVKVTTTDAEARHSLAS
jgi:hypothetical protein